MVEARVERDGFILNGRRRRISSIVIVTDSLYKIEGPAGMSRLSFIRVRDDRAEHVDDTVRATPQARSLANEMGILIGEVTGSGVDGQIKVSDVKDFSIEKAAATVKNIE